MGARKRKQDLSDLPLHFKKKNRSWWIDTKTGKWIHNSNIAQHLPQPKIETQDYIRNYYNN